MHTYWIQAKRKIDGLPHPEEYRYEELTAEQALFLRNNYIIKGFSVETGKKRLTDSVYVVY